MSKRKKYLRRSRKLLNLEWEKIESDIELACRYGYWNHRLDLKLKQREFLRKILINQSIPFKREAGLELMENFYYIALFTDSGKALSEIDRELCVLRTVFDSLSETGDYSVDVGYEYSGKRLIMIHMYVRGLYLMPFITYKESRVFKEKYHRFRLWTFGDGYAVPVSELKGEPVKILSNYCDEVFTWKGSSYNRKEVTGLKYGT